MTFDARNGVNPSVDFVLAHIIATMREGAFGGITEFIARLDIFPVGVAVGAERFVVAGVAGLPGRSGIKTVPVHKIRCAMIECSP